MAISFGDFAVRSKALYSLLDNFKKNCWYLIFKRDNFKNFENQIKSKSKKKDLSGLFIKFTTTWKS